MCSGNRMVRPSMSRMLWPTADGAMGMTSGSDSPPRASMGIATRRPPRIQRRPGMVLMMRSTVLNGDTRTKSCSVLSIRSISPRAPIQRLGPLMVQPLTMSLPSRNSPESFMRLYSSPSPVRSGTVPR